LKTKEKIISTATRLFNNQGYNSINLFELANQLGISRGNLTYHFKDKESLLVAICDEMWSKIENERSKTMQLPSFENLHNEIQLYYKFQKEYSFIFSDPNVISQPFIRNKFKEMTNKTIADIKAGIAFSINVGNVVEEKIAGTYNNIAFITWMLAFYWDAQKEICDMYKKMDGEKIIWSFMSPYFTEKGKASFIKFFGEDYFKAVNQKFDINLSSYIAF
tara:strand:+ start:4614 stop:5270 length:657 start_codon:yes stop_codon:yes gene_type:complete